MKQNLRTEVSKYMSYLLRHNPEDLKMDNRGFVDLDELSEKLKQRFGTNCIPVREIVEESDRQRFEIVGMKIRALYGHSIRIAQELEEDKLVKTLYHGTTPEALPNILQVGLKPMKRKLVHLSPTKDVAAWVALRRTRSPTILEIDAEAARKSGVKFYKATDKVYLSDSLPPRVLKVVTRH